MEANEPSASALLANVKTRIANFHASDLLPTFAFLKKKPKNSSPIDATLRTTKTRRSNSDFLNGSASKTLGAPLSIHPLSSHLIDDDLPDKTFSPSDSSQSSNEESSPTEDCKTLLRPDLVGLFADTFINEAENSALENLYTFYGETFWRQNDDDQHDGLCDDYFNDTIERQHFGTYKSLKTLGKKMPALGHNFEIAQLTNPTFCDKCGDFIWGLYKQAVKCQKCHYTCHYKCQALVTLDCRSFSDSGSSSQEDNSVINEVLNHDEVRDEAHEASPLQENESARSTETSSEESARLRLLIDDFNEQTETLKMTVEENGRAFRGFIQIYMNISRPISIVAGEKPSSIYDVMNPDASLHKQHSGVHAASEAANETSGAKTITSFFLPRNSAKILHISSETSTRQMIAALLKKFKVADNPFKFALYERDTLPGQTLQTRLRRFADDAKPLQTLLTWGSQSNKRFVLQENDTGDILWHYFEPPELENFLIILEREEKQYIGEIRKKFDAYRFYIQCELKERGVPVVYNEKSVNQENLDDMPSYLRKESANGKMGS